MNPDLRWLRRNHAQEFAVAMSDFAVGRSSPNPPVGAVVLDADDVIVGMGATEEPGGRHAEVVALDNAGPAAAGGTIVVTLEPCDHTGRTGPCTERILASGIERVRYGVRDPNPVAAGGADRLRAAGIEVEHDERLEYLAGSGPLRPWLHRVRSGRPLVTWKYAASLDGKVAARDGTSKWITGPAARDHAHSKRARADAIVVGTGTQRADDPTLSARHPDGSPRGHSPLACVMGLSEVPADAAIRRSPGGFAHLATRDPAAALTELAEDHGALHVIVEGGPSVASAFLRAGLVDEIDAYVAPILIGAGAGAVNDCGVETVSRALRFDPWESSWLGGDLYTHLRRAELGGEYGVGEYCGGGHGGHGARRREGED